MIVRVSIILLLFCMILKTREVASLSIEKIPQYAAFNITKRPLNLYITANGKHAVVNNRTLESHKQNVAQSKEFDYLISQPPFAIKRRGSAILLHNVTGNSLSWNQGRPSVVQMVAASGHTAVAVQLVSGVKDKVHANAKLIREVIAAEGLRNITFISADANGDDIIAQLLDSLSTGVKTEKTDKTQKDDLTELVDGIVLLKDNTKNVRDWYNKLPQRSDQNVIPLLVVWPGKDHAKINGPKIDSTNNDNSNGIKIVDEQKDTGCNSDDGRFHLMQKLANFFDFIHPR